MATIYATNALPSTLLTAHCDLLFQQHTNLGLPTILPLSQFLYRIPHDHYQSSCRQVRVHGTCGTRTITWWGGGSIGPPKTGLGGGGKGSIDRDQFY